MPRHQIILDATSRTLAHVPPGYVSAATYAIEDISRGLDDATRVLSSGACTVASWTITTSAAAGPTQSNGRKLSTASTTGPSIGDPAVVTGTDGTTEVIEIAAISSNSYIEALTTLAGTYASSSTVKGLKLTAAIDDADAADEDLLKRHPPLRVVWTYTLGSTKYIVQEPIEFVRQTDAGPGVGEVLLAIAKQYPDMPNRMPDGTRWDSLVASLARDIRVDLKARDIDPEAFMTGEAGISLYVAKVCEHAGFLGYSPGSQDQRTWADLAAKRYRMRLEALTIGTAGRRVLETHLATDTASGNPSDRYHQLISKT
jgi:hypothetical protein